VTHATRPALVTVLVACRDPHRGYLGEALRSVLAQTTPRWRLLLVVDDDDLAGRAAARDALAGAGADADPRLGLVRNRGRWITGAFNTGMRRAATPWVCVLHADDLLDRRAVAVLHRHIARHPRADYFHSARRYVDDHGRPLSGVRSPVPRVSPRDFLDRGPVKSLHCWRVAAALAIGGMDESLGPHGADDYDFPWRMAEAGCVFRPIPDCLYLFRDHRSHPRLTTHVPLDVQVEELRRILRKHRVPEPEIERQIARRSAGYLRQALYLDEEDRRRKEARGFEPGTGWRQSY
jgi:hypothetical protein